MRRRAFNTALAALGAATLGGCLPAYRAAPAAAQVAPPAAWREPAAGAATVDPHWWRAFGDPALASLVEAALARNSDVLIAVARIDEARAQAELAESARLPALNGAIGLQTGRALEATGISTSRVIQPNLTANWELDLFGRIRNQVRAANLQYQATQAERAAAALSVAASTAQNYVALLALDAQLFITRETVASRAEALRLAQDQARVGYISQLQLTQAQSEYQSVLGAIPELELAVRRQENALRLLAGDLPGDVLDDTAHGAGFAALRLPPVPGVLPSQLLARRPDIFQRELLLAAADVNLAVRRQAFLPQVSLSAQLGSLFVNALDYDPVTVWSLGGSVLAPLFSGGRLNAQVEAAASQRDQAAFAYRRTVLTAFSEVENALAGVPRLAEQVSHAVQRRAILTRSLGYATDRYQAGYASYLEQLDAQRNLYQVELNLVTLQRTQMENVIGLYRALGGGWAVGPER
ncbi:MULTISPECIES: efflux transporter outer membrane subunit [unclassified Massilia]|uniref:efflux transporter outer membrane subunit n=1 Tax=unclassified Massilia TaxID=2609279 RepID=UPI00178180C0|nr:MULTISPECIES: efflux transporter outer membrane subunit [unclassified Massilia]MBD8528590.1 efflux transporter outer membrane subunit [Massilia sp. CFBP 13647]MBD8671787.1 efflux transporter outer membrane subunit [Massilia sp. CFBP 13721]